MRGDKGRAIRTIAGGENGPRGQLRTASARRGGAFGGGGRCEGSAEEKKEEQHRAVRGRRGNLDGADKTTPVVTAESVAMATDFAEAVAPCRTGNDATSEIFSLQLYVYVWALCSGG